MLIPTTYTSSTRKHFGQFVTLPPHLLAIKSRLEAIADSTPTPPTTNRRPVSLGKLLGLREAPATSA